jgi:tetratricopeptide (TPR) repeat protein
MENKQKEAEELKAKGNEEFKAANYEKAKEYYSQAIGTSGSPDK